MVFFYLEMGSGSRQRSGRAHINHRLVLLDVLMARNSPSLHHSFVYQVAHPFISSLSIEAVKAELHSAFLLRSAQQPAVTLKGQMVLTRLAGGTGEGQGLQAIT